MKKTKSTNTQTIIVTIDGPSASGKSTVAREVAKKIKFEHLDTGAIYRAIALWCYQQGLTEQDREKWLPRLDEVEYMVESAQGVKNHKLNGKVVNHEIRLPHISQLASKIAVIGDVRNLATEIQRQMAKDKNIVVEGRDAGTVVFPKAEVKIYLTANREERAKRRLQELMQKYPEDAGDFSLEETIKELEERDDRDSQREASPMKKAYDAITIDTTGLSIEDVIEKIVKIIKQRRKRSINTFWKWMVGEKRAHTTFAYKICLLIASSIYHIFYRIKVYGLENYPLNDECATIVAPNHVSFLDPPAIAVAVPCELNALAIDYLFKAPLLGWILPKINVHPVSSSVTDAGVMRMVVSLLQQGKHVLIFPEGSRSLDNQLLPLKRGVSVLASLTKCSITPTYIDGAYEIWKRGNWLPKPWGKISIVFGKPLYFRDYEARYPSKKEAEQALLKDLRERILELQANFKRAAT